VLVSLNIRPYLEAVEGFEDRFSQQNEAAIDVFNLEDYSGKGRDVLIKGLSDGNYDLCISVGPEASRLMRSDKLSGKILKIYTMLLNPGKIFNSNESICGIPLDIPGKLIMQTLLGAFPSVKRVGLLYDPKNNLEFARQAVGDSALMEMKIIPLEVSSRKDIPIVLQENWGKIDGLWLIPDRTVSVESLVRHVIKEAISNGVAVFGYNRFFYESGAAWCYVLDYKEIGRQTAELSLAR